MDFLNPSFWLFVAVIAGIYGIMALGLYVQYSLAGLPNFGHVAFMAVAAYGMAILVVRFEAPLLLAAVGGLLAAVFLAIVMGAPALRLRADYLAIATVAGGEIVRYLALNLSDITGGPIGSIGMRAKIWRISPPAVLRTGRVFWSRPKPGRGPMRCLPPSRVGWRPRA